jgi:hypothetical protein
VDAVWEQNVNEAVECSTLRLEEEVEWSNLKPAEVAHEVDVVEILEVDERQKCPLEDVDDGQVSV